MANASERNQADDEALWLSFTKGDEAAFEPLFTRYFPKLFRYGRKFSSDPEFVKDAIQDLFTELWQRRTYLGQTLSVRHYLFKSLRRKMGRLSTNRPATDELTDEADQFNATISPEELLLDDEFTAGQTRQMAQWLSFLTPRQREAMYLRFYQDMEYEEIASVMAISNQATRNLIYEALKLLRNRLIVVVAGLLLGATVYFSL